MSLFARNAAKLLVLAVSLVWVTCADAVGLDCNKAVAKVEKIICADATLRAQDDTLNRFYQWALEDAYPVDRSDIVARQKKWLDQVRGACTTAACLHEAYGGRIEELSEIEFAGGSATYLSDARDVMRAVDQIKADLKQVGITSRVSGCTHVLSLDAKPHGVGAFCNLGAQKQVAVCEENMFGSLALDFYTAKTGSTLATFAHFACRGD